MGDLDTDGILRAVAAAPAVSPATRPQAIGAYELEELLGKGGMGAVYAARHRGTGRKVALKVIVPRYADSAGAIERFRREAKALGRLQHPHVVDVTDFGADGDQLYLVMEHLAGRSLRKELGAHKKLPLAEVVDIVEQIAAALTAAHEVGIVHRDLKPENIQLVPTGTGKNLVKVLDFGVAKLAGAEDVLPALPPDAPTEPGFAPATASVPTVSATLTDGVAVGTPLYMAPEQMLAKPVDARADVYALAALAWECLTGKPPREGNAQALFVHHLENIPLRLESKGVPRAVRRTIELGLARDPAERPDARAFAHLLRTVAAGADGVYAAAVRAPDEGERVRAIVCFAAAPLLMLALVGAADRMTAGFTPFFAMMLFVPWLAGGAVALWVRRRARPWEILGGPVLAAVAGTRLPAPTTPLVAALFLRSVLGLLAAAVLVLMVVFLAAIAFDVEWSLSARAPQFQTRGQPVVLSAAAALLVTSALALQGVLCVRFVRTVRMMSRRSPDAQPLVARRTPTWSALAAFILVAAGGVGLGADALLLRSLSMGMAFTPVLLLELGASAQPRDGVDPMALAITSDTGGFPIQRLANGRRDADETRYLLRALTLEKHEAAVTLLAYTRVDLGARDERGRSPLTLGARFDDPGARLAVVRALLEAGADPERPDADGVTPRQRLNALGDASIDALLANFAAKRARAEKKAGAAP